MRISVEATYENKTLKLDGPLPLAEHEKVRVTVEPVSRGAALVPAHTAEPAEPPLAEQMEALIRALPAGALDSLPDDLAAELAKAMAEGTRSELVIEAADAARHFGAVRCRADLAEDIFDAVEDSLGALEIKLAGLGQVSAGDAAFE